MQQKHVVMAPDFIGSDSLIQGPLPPGSSGPTGKGQGNCRLNQEGNEGRAEGQMLLCFHSFCR